MSFSFLLLCYFAPVVCGGDRELAKWLQYKHEDMCWILYTHGKALHCSHDADTGRSQRLAVQPPGVNP